MIIMDGWMNGWLRQSGFKNAKEEKIAKKKKKHLEFRSLLVASQTTRCLIDWLR